MNTEDLELAADRANTALYVVTQERDQRLSQLHRERVEPLQERVRAERVAIADQVHEEFGERIDAASRARDEANAALDAARVAHATMDTGWLPVDTVVEEWKQYRYGWARQDGRRRDKTGRHGIVRVWDAGSRYPGNAGRWSLPSPGEVYVRLLRKDGTESAKFERIVGWNGHDDWYAEGVDPNEQQEAA